MLFDSKGSYDQRNEKELKKKIKIHGPHSKKKEENRKREVGSWKTGKKKTLESNSAIATFTE